MTTSEKVKALENAALAALACLTYMSSAEYELGGDRIVRGLLQEALRQSGVKVDEQEQIALAREAIWTAE